MRRNTIIILVIVIAILLIAAAVVVPLPATAPESAESPLPITSPAADQGSSTILPEPTASPSPSVDALQQPVAEFAARITKKPFGILITAQNSPVQPERFEGYHTGADVEYDDITEDVPVKAITAGTVLQSHTASGYGGVIAIQHEINGEPVVAIYGHLDPKSLVKTGTTLQAGQQIGILGDDKSSETDGERKHLHFALLPGTKVDLRGYVANKSDLSLWQNPLTLF